MSQPIRSHAASARAAPSEYDHAYAAERGHWLRRRFIAYCVLCLILSAAAMPPVEVGPGDSATLRLLHALGPWLWAGSIVTYLTFIVYAWRSRPAYMRMLRLAFLIYVVTGVLGLALTHLFFTQIVRETLDEVAQLQAAHGATTLAEKPTTQPATQAGPTAVQVASPAVGVGPPAVGVGPPAQQVGPPPTAPATVNGGITTTVTVGDPQAPTPSPVLAIEPEFAVVWLIMLLGLAFHHLLTCLLIPWKLSESLRAAAVLLVVLLAIVAADAAVRQLHSMAPTLAMTGAVGCVVPGSLVCWWRFSRFNRKFRLRFESSQFLLLEDELERARRIHDAVLPAQRREGPLRIEYVYEPARQIGGDTLFVHPKEVGGGAVSVVLLDVTGHGISAALTLNRILGELGRSFSDNPDTPPHALIANLNRYVHDTLAPHGVFVTAIALRFTPEDGQVQLVNAGHPPAYWLMPDGRCEQIDSTAMLLGVVGPELFEVETRVLTLAPGHRLVLYTDGASEAANPAGCQLGLAGVKEMLCDLASDPTLRPADWPAVILGRVVRYRQSPPRDDTLVAVLSTP